MTQLRILIVEDHGLVRAGLRAIIDGRNGFVVVGEAADGLSAIELATSLRPDVVLLDITLPGLGGLQVLRRLSEEEPAPRVLMLSVHDSEEYVWQSLRLGAAGYLLKDSEPAELELALRSVARGRVYLSPGISGSVVADLVGDHERHGRGPLGRLTPRQIEIVQLIAEGRTNREIAHALGIGVKTVETHRATVMERLDIHDVPGLVRFAVRVGLVPAER